MATTTAIPEETRIVSATAIERNTRAITTMLNGDYDLRSLRAAIAEARTTLDYIERQASRAARS